MPLAPKHPCPGKGPRRNACPNLVARGERCCADCLPYMTRESRAYDVERDKGEQRQFLHSTTWRKIRAAKLRRDPLCERHLEQGRTVAATMVHHVDGDELHNDDENHWSLCNDCHEEIEKGGRWGREASSIESIG